MTDILNCTHNYNYNDNNDNDDNDDNDEYINHTDKEIFDMVINCDELLNNINIRKAFISIVRKIKTREAHLFPTFSKTEMYNLYHSLN